MKRYSQYDKSYIYAAFPERLRDRVLLILEGIGAGEDVRFYFEKNPKDRLSKTEKRRMEGACGLILFVTEEFFKTEKFHEIVNTAVGYGKNIVCVYLEKAEQTPWSELQLGSQQAVVAEQFSDDTELTAALKESEIFRHMSVTGAQKRIQRNRGIALVTLPIVAAALIFGTVVYPLLIVPEIEKEQELEKVGLAGLTTEELESITELHIVGDRRYDSLTRVENYTDATKSEIVIRVYDKEHGSWEEETVSVETGRISDISALRYCKNLEILTLSGMQISDISPLFELKNLKELRMTHNPIRSIEGIEKLENLMNLELGSTYITDISPAFRCTNLRQLAFQNTHVSDLTGIEQLVNLNDLAFHDTKVPEVPELPELEELRLLTNGCRLTDAAFLKNVRAFGELQLDDYTEDLQEDVLVYISGKPIAKLSLSGAKIDSIEDLSGLDTERMEYLSLAWGHLRTLDGIEHLEGIRELDLPHCQMLEDLSPVLKLESLKVLRVSSDMIDRAEAQLAGRTFEIEIRDD